MTTMKQRDSWNTIKAERFELVDGEHDVETMSGDRVKARLRVARAGGLLAGAVVLRFGWSLPNDEGYDLVSVNLLGRDPPPGHVHVRLASDGMDDPRVRSWLETGLFNDVGDHFVVGGSLYAVWSLAAPVLAALDRYDQAAASSRPYFGIRPPSGVEVAWGARLLLEVNSTPADADGERSISRTSVFGYVPDRTSTVGSGPRLDALVSWATGVGLPMLREHLASQPVDPGSRDPIVLCDSGYVLEANPRGSHGYLFVGAWSDPVADAQTAASE